MKVIKTINLNKYIDKRGLILDLFYKSKINHVAYITTKKNCIRGNHYHKKTTQYTFIIKGKIYYFSKKNKKKKKKILKKGDMVISYPKEVHAFKGLTYDSEMIVFSQGLRGGKDYEKDTFRVENIVD